MAAVKPTCIVLGGGGFLGLNLCRHLVSVGYRVRAFGRQCLFPGALQGVSWFPGEASDADAMAAAVRSCEVMLYVLGTVLYSDRDDNMANNLHENVSTALQCFDVGRKLGVKRVVFISSGGSIYGAAAEIPTPETAPTKPLTPYGLSKLTIEKYLSMYESVFGLDYRIVRVSNAFGPFQVPKKGHGIIATLISRVLNNQRIEIWGDGSIVRDYIFVDDVAAAVERAMNDISEQRIFNIGSGQGRTLNDVVRSIEGLLNVKLEIDWKPGRPGDVPRSILAVERARATLGWMPSISFEAGLRRTVDWWQSNRHHQ